jgi:pyruvate dehydrogenase E2 component (dihydrolipoamide acetyltransferase)
MPKMGLEMEEGEVVSWEFDEGDEITKGEAVAIVESEKATNEVEAREDGVLREIFVPEGTFVDVSAPIGIVAGPDEDISDLIAEIPDSVTETTEETAPATESTASAEDEAAESAQAAVTEDAGADRGGASAADVQASPGARKAAQERGVPIAQVEGTGPQGTIIEDDVIDYAESAPSEVEAAWTADEEPMKAEGRATPGAKELANERGLDLTKVAGSGPQGTITERDVRDPTVSKTADSGATTVGTQLQDDEATRSVSEVREQSKIQRTVGKRMSQSSQEAPHVTINRTFDSRRMQTIKEVAAASGVDVSLTDLLLSALGAQLEANPEFNALYQDGEHRLIEEVNVGVAVDIGDGLITPVVPNVTARGVESISQIRAERTERALSGSFSSQDLSGGTFTVTNLGMFGVDDFTPIISPPEVAILGVGGIDDDGEMTLSISIDHRVINGADAARFLDGLVDRLTDTEALLGQFESNPFER